MGRAGIEVSSRLNASPEAVWERVITPDTKSSSVGRSGRSWVLLLGLPRLPLPATVLRPLFQRLFRHRHRRLIKRFGGAPAG